MRQQETRLKRGLSIVSLKAPVNITSDQSNLTKRPHRRRTWTIQWYLPGGITVHTHLIHASLSPPGSTIQTA